MTEPSPKGEKKNADIIFTKQAEGELEKKQLKTVFAEANGEKHVKRTMCQNYSLIKISVLFFHLMPPLPFPSTFKILKD